MPRDCGSRSAPTASSLQRRQPVVTMRAMPQPSRSYRWLAQVMTPRDGLPDPSSTRTVQRGPSSCPLPAGSVQSRAEEAPPRALGQWLRSMNRIPTGSAIDANAACRGGKQQRNGTKREWCPESLVDPDRLAFGTDRNTNQTGFTHQQQRKGQKQRGNKRRKGLNQQRSRCET